MLKGENVTLRPIKRSDLGLFLMWHNDLEVKIGEGSYQPLMEAPLEQYIEAKGTKSGKEEVNLIIDVVTASDVTPIGSVGLHNIDWRNAVANLGITIGNKAYWNKGYGTEATRLLLRYGFEQLNLPGIVVGL